MNEIDYEMKCKIIKENFNDERAIKCRTPEDVRKLDEDVYPGGDVFTTEGGEFIDFEFQEKDFDEEELTKYIDFAENLYEKHGKKVSVYIVCPKNINVTVRECPIKSESDFTIKLACIEQDFCHIILDDIKRKIREHKLLDEEDITALEMLPVMCNKNERHYFRLESLKIINRYVY